MHLSNVPSTKRACRSIPHVTRIAALSHLDFGQQHPVTVPLLGAVSYFGDRVARSRCRSAWQRGSVFGSPQYSRHVHGCVRAGRCAFGHDGRRVERVFVAFESADGRRRPPRLYGTRTRIVRPCWGQEARTDRGIRGDASTRKASRVFR
jgi:hypothetical protein